MLFILSAVLYNPGNKWKQIKNIKEPIDKKINDVTRFSFFFFRINEINPPIIRGTLTDKTEINKASNIIKSPKINIHSLFSYFNNYFLLYKKSPTGDSL